MAKAYTMDEMALRHELVNNYDSLQYEIGDYKLGKSLEGLLPSEGLTNRAAAEKAKRRIKVKKH